MYPVSANFHNLIIQDAPTTRVRIFFIGDGVDCTDDNDVQTNGTLLVGAVGDTDSNGRIGQGGITFNNFFNNEKNLLIGDSVSSQIKLTLLNYDGALNGFQFGRCKIYLDVYDSANSTWLTCPMGVYTIEQPTKTRKKLIEVSGFDQMQKLEQIADDWYNALTWTNGITFYDLITGIATELGVSVSATTQSNLLNSTVSFTEPPFDCIEVTYRELLELVAEATGTTARFDKDGALDLKWFSAAQIGGSTYTVNTDAASGNRCFGIELVEYQAAQVDALKIKIATDDIGTVVGSGTNQYVIADNMFLSGPDAATIIAKATPIYNRLNAIGAYNPIQIKFIADPSIEAGDIINVTNGGTTYTMPVFQQTMKWRGGYVVSVALADGDKTRPVLTSSERAYYRLNSEKVGENNIISKINQSAEQISIQANKLSLYGYTTINNGFKVNMDGTFEANGATINGTINVGGNNDTLGAIKVYDSSGTLVGRISNAGLETWNPSGVLGLVEYSRVAAGAVRLVTGSTMSVRLNRTAEEAAGTVEVYDKNGILRWFMHGNSTGPTLSLRDANSVIRIILAQGFNTGIPFIQLNDANGKGRVGLTVIDSTGYESIYLLNSNEQYAGRMYSDGTDTAVELTSNDGTRTATLSTSQTGLSLPNGNATIGGTLSVTGAATLGSDLSVAGDESVTGDLTVSGDTTLDGVLDVTKRRCSATLSSAGWYRGMQYNASWAGGATGSVGAMVDFNICRMAANGYAETHKTTLVLKNNGISFGNEFSSGGTLYVDKIRYTVNGAVGYVDIHYSASASNTVGVDFTVHVSDNSFQSHFVAKSLQSVADAPTGETVVTTYEFAEIVPYIGTNANGTYRKYPDGTLICTKRVNFGNIQPSDWTAWGAWYESTSKYDAGDWPVAFTQVPTLSATQIQSGTNEGVAVAELWMDRTTSKIGKTYFYRPTAGYIYSVTYDFVGIGRWK